MNDEIKLLEHRPYNTYRKFYENGDADIKIGKKTYTIKYEYNEIYDDVFTDYETELQITNLPKELEDYKYEIEEAIIDGIKGNN